MTKMGFQDKIFIRISIAFFGLFFGATLVFALAEGARAAVTPVLKTNAAQYSRADNQFVSAVVMDSSSGKVLYSYQPAKKWPPASITKLMSALVTLEHHQPWDSLVSVSSKDEVGGARLNVKPGARATVRDLFYSSLVGSANNTTMTLARVSGLGTSGFIKRMNQKAKELKMADTVFTEPTGIMETNMTTAADLAKLTEAAFSQYTIRRAASTMRYRFYERPNSLLHTLINTNHLLTRDQDIYVLGGKTGYIDEAMYNLAVKVKLMKKTVPVLTIVVMGAPTKQASFDSTKALALWAWNAYDWSPSAAQLSLAH
ncbi:MAG: serine hydrolase [Patescibacteria group bacterium]|nr:serine hydrolase [Patescibacteria group bacterium]